MTDLEEDSAHPLGGEGHLSRLGLGSWVFGGTGWGTQHDRDSRAAILRAVELGVNWIDTAAVYGDGHAEELIGRTLKELPEDERPHVFTKCGVRIDPSTGATFRELRPQSLRRECTESLKRLGVERIDLYQVHWPVEDSHIVAEAWATLGELRDEGKIRWAGVSNFDIRLLEMCSGAHHIDAVQVPLSLLSRESAQDLLPWSVGHKVHALAYSPLESGLLSGGFSAERVKSLHQTDWRRRRKQFQWPRVGRTLDLLERVEPMAADLGASLAELAIAWTLTWPGTAGVIVGGRTAAQVETWARAGSLMLADSLLAEIAAALIETGAGNGPVLPATRPANPAT